MKYIVSFVVAVIAWNVLGTVWPGSGAVCVDGFASSSIGKQGACSWHGGVSQAGSLRGFVIVLAGIIAGGAAFFRLDNWESQRTKKNVKKAPANIEKMPKKVPDSQPTQKRVDSGNPPIDPRLSQPKIKPTCPECNAIMHLRKARRGATKGKRFWGCSRWPDCNGTRLHKLR